MRGKTNAEDETGWGYLKVKQKENYKDEFLLTWENIFIVKLIFSFLGIALVGINIYLTDKFLAPYPILILTLLFTFYNLLFNYFFSKYKPLNYLSIALTIAFIDGIIATGFIYFSGGPQSFAFSLYLFIIFFFTFFRLKNYSYLLAFTYFIFYSCLLLLDIRGFLPFYQFEGQFIWPPRGGENIIFIRVFVIFIILFTFSYLSERFVKNINLETRRSKALQDGTFYLTQAIGNRKEILQRLLHTAIEVTEADSASLIEFKDNEWRFIAWENIDDKVIEKVGEEFKNNPPRNLEMIRSSGKILDIPNTRDISYWAKAGHAKSYIGCPLILKGEVIAVLNIDSGKANKFSPEDMQVVESLSRIATEVIEKNLLLEKEGYLRQLADEASIRDYLTGLYNRRELERVFKQEISRSLRYEGKFQVLIIDLDHFKRVNDNYGHLEGDRFLVDFSSILRESTRKSDLIFRYGGDEFIILLVNSTSSSVGVVIERIERAFRQIFADFVEKLKIDFSYGFLSFPDDLEAVIKGGAFKGDFVDTLYNLIFVRIDEFLYKNKESKGNI